MSRIAKDLSKSAPWHIHPPPSPSSSDVITGSTNGPSKPGRHSSSNFSPIINTRPTTSSSSSRGSPASYSTLASAASAPTASSAASHLSLDNMAPPHAPGTGTSTTTSSSPPGLSIAIIGAGIASLRAATLLLRSLPSTTTLTIYEARNRVGGRLHQSTVGGHRVDMGPNWIHGVHGNPIMALAERTGTTTVEPEEDGDVFDERGRRMGREEARGVGADVWEGVSEAFVYSDRESEGLGVGESLYGWFERRFGEMKREGKGRWEGLSPEEGERRLRDVLNETRMWGPFVGENIERQSLKFFWMEECVDGGNVFVADTYEKVLEEVARPVLESGCVRFGSAVERMEVLQSDKGVKLTVRDVSGGEDHEGPVSEAVFDEVICTAPLGWLKRHKRNAFIPPLPDRVDRAIDKISYGRLEKLYVTFPRAFWLDEPIKSSTGGTTNESPIDDNGNNNGGDDDDDNNNDPSRPLALFTHFHHPTPPAYHPLVPSSQSPPSWNQNLVSLAHLPSPSAHPTLLFYIYGDCAASLVRSVSGLTEGSKEYEEALWAFAEPWVAKLPGYSEGRGECRSKAALCTRWQEDGWAGNGSYACFLVGLVDGEGDVSGMREGGGLGKEVEENEEGEGEGKARQPRRGGLWLAGEHTAPVVALGTTTGAWWSGEGVARRICAKWGVEVVEDEVAGQGVVADQKGGEVVGRVHEERLSGGGPGGIVAGKEDGSL